VDGRNVPLAAVDGRWGVIADANVKLVELR